MIDFVLACWDILVDSSAWMFLGFFMAGLLRSFVPEDLVARNLGARKAGSVFKAALFGVPLPLCSCGVIPAAAGLRRQGASKGATAAFLIATPETGVDSMAVSWAMLDPLMTVLRPVSAFITAVFTGTVINALDRDRFEPQTATALTSSTCPSGSCSCRQDASVPPSLWVRFLAGQRFAFGDLLGDVVPWFGLGILIAGVISLFLPTDFGQMIPGGKFSAMLVMLAVSLPLYVCATASTPIAAALAMKGFSPGALLVFLLAGPATNAATIVTVARLLGKRAVTAYVLSIIGMTLVCAILADSLYLWLGLSVSTWLGGDAGESRSLVGSVAAVVMVSVLAWQLWGKTRFRSVQE